VISFKSYSPDKQTYIQRIDCSTWIIKMVDDNVNRSFQWLHWHCTSAI